MLLPLVLALMTWHMAPIAQSADGVSWILMSVELLMTGAGGLDLGRRDKPRSSFLKLTRITILV
jgi:hypothetical protein